jgi:DNA-binding transcriptional regulator YhcF (GntR family)
MKYNFTEDAKRTLTAAREAAIALQHDYMGTEHILAGFLDVDDTRELRERLGLARDTLKQRLFDAVRRGKARVPLTAELPYTSRAKKSLEYALESASEMRADSVGADHLLLGLLREEKGIAAQLLNAVGVTLEAATRAIDESLGHRFRVQIDDAAEVSIYEQIIAQVQEAVATGALSPGERLPTVRRLADRLDIAPGTVARAYSELERRGVVITEGARGTRVAGREQQAEQSERPETLAGLLRPVAVAAFHMGATAKELRAALERAMHGIFANGESS